MMVIESGMGTTEIEWPTPLDARMSFSAIFILIPLTTRPSSSARSDTLSPFKVLYSLVSPGKSFE